MNQEACTSCPSCDGVDFRHCLKVSSRTLPLTVCPGPSPQTLTLTQLYRVPLSPHTLVWCPCLSGLHHPMVSRILLGQFREWPSPSHPILFPFLDHLSPLSLLPDRTPLGWRPGWWLSSQSTFSANTRTRAQFSNTLSPPKV